MALEERSASLSVSEHVGILVTPTREGYLEVAELLGYGTIFHDRTAYLGASMSVGIPQPVFTEIPQPQLGWGTPLLPPIVFRVSQGGSIAGLSVSEEVVPPQ